MMTAPRKLFSIELTDDFHRAISREAIKEKVSFSEMLRRVAELGLHCHTLGNLPKDWRMIPYQIGQVVGNFTVTGPIVTKGRSRKYQMFRCVCGKERLFSMERMIAGQTKSCGCISKARTFVYINDKKMGIYQACKQYKLPGTSIRYRMLDKGATLQEAFDYVLDKKRRGLLQTRPPQLH